MHKTKAVGNYLWFSKIIFVINMLKYKYTLLRLIWANKHCAHKKDTIFNAFGG